MHYNTYRALRSQGIGPASALRAANAVHTALRTGRALCLALLACALVQADTIGLHLGTWHSSPGFENANPGMYVERANGMTYGAFRNSLGRTSVYAGQTWHYGPLALTAGAATGYIWPIAPLLVPSVRLNLTPTTSLRIAALPHLGKASATAAVHVMAERRFK